MATGEKTYTDGAPLHLRIKAAMAARHMNMRALADVTAIPYGTLQGYLLGRNAIPAIALGRIADALTVSADWLLFGRPATFDMECLQSALDLTDDVRNIAANAGHGSALRTFGKLFADVYTGEYTKRHGSGVEGSPAEPANSRGRRGR